MTDGLRKCTTLLLVGLMSRFHSSHHSVTTFNILCRLSLLCAISAMSSAYNKILRKLLSIWIPQIKLLMRSAKSFTYIANNDGDKRHPCLKRQSTLSHGVYLSFTRTVHRTFSYSDRTADRSLPCIPHFLCLYHNKFLGTESNDFRISKKQSKVDCLDIFLFEITECKLSICSSQLRFERKPFCSSHTIELSSESLLSLRFRTLQ